MSNKYKWDWSEADKAENANLLKPETVEKSVAPLVGAEAAAMIAEGVQEYLKEKGLDKIDRKYLAFPEAHRQSDPSADYSECDLTDVTPWDELPVDAQLRRKVLTKSLLRKVLFSTSTDESLKSYGDQARAVAKMSVRTMSSAGGGGSEGGYLIPPGYIPYLVKDIPRLSVLYPKVTTLPTGQSNSGRLPTVATNATSSWGSESVAIDPGDPSFGQATYTIYRHNTRIVLPLELVADSNPAIVETVIGLIQEAMAHERDRCIAYGNGSGRPTGIYQSSGITDVSGITSITYPNLNKMLFSVDMRWHDSPSFCWTLNQNVLSACAALVDDHGIPILRTGGIGNGLPPTLLGKPFVVSNSFPNTYIGIGLLAGYLWFDRGDMGMLTEMGGAYADAHQMMIKVWERADGKYVNTPTSRFARSKILAGITNLVTPG
jgi:HK97 family phage major capsid protein